MRSFVPIVLSLILGTALSHELVTPLEKDEQQNKRSFGNIPVEPVVVDHTLRRQMCTPSVSTTKTSFAVGEEVLVTVNICQSAVEWFGIWPAGSNPTSSPAANWQYTCGGQSCASAYPVGQPVGGFRYGFNRSIQGAGGWPLSGGTYQVYYHSVFGTLGGQQFSIGTSTS